ncbi:hypothetical protein SAY86_014896 [Trapa natans]|uniref:Uncharacterized protein n=1 Tax=Trapa natans TaxID=22666 RepID=A0AAN7QGC9_TRANT|nr:hypothetical protein SAY86_014896 [Trapa natans]
MKRSEDDMQSTDSVGSLSEYRPNKKKREGQEEVTANQSDAYDGYGANLDLPDAPHGLLLSQSCNGNRVIVEETRILVVEEVATLSSEPIDHEKCPIRVGIYGVKNNLPLSDEDAVPLLEPLAQKTLQEQLESVGLVTKEDQLEDGFTQNFEEFGDQDSAE